ncbi:MAG TPA: DEAD/DEAH box helicase family protein [Polyangiaceae bacterium]|nr:DEAD/DEAH box helicase family protein [Polyangiaceae bacterium]
MNAPTTPATANPFVRTYDLAKARNWVSSARDAQAHQLAALKKVKAWFERPTPPEGSGGLLVLPTGGGKTFTAVRFLCEWPLSEGYKVLWLAHTHHLLEQAFDTFGPMSAVEDRPVEVAKIREPKEQLRVRVVSGMPGHASMASIAADDDVLIASLRTIANGFRDDHKPLFAFLEAAGDKLVVVFDEAHHAPAPTYARLIEALRERIKNLRVLGLTATPIYENKLRRGWLARLFPQDILHQVTAQSLMAAKILAEPVIEECETHVKPEVDERRLERWLGTYTDIPDDIVQWLAENQGRNDVIVDTYVKNRKKYGKTLIFADRWSQCDYLRTALRRHKIRADVVYSHVDAKLATVDQRNRRTADDNTKAIRAFKNGELDVLINVRMLTEGTDVPDVQTVFLTRQTTSRVLMTQMVGRALRGPKFGGTEKAYVVSFIDDWRKLINWADFRLDEGPTSEAPSPRRDRVPLHLVSIELLRRLAAQMYQPASAQPVSFLQTVPVGWYHVRFDTLVDADGDIEPVERLILVYSAEQEKLAALVAGLAKRDLGAFLDPLVTFEQVQSTVEEWCTAGGLDKADHTGGDLARDVFDLARHVAQAMGDLPTFFPFAERDHHDLDALARTAFERNIGRREIPGFVRNEFERGDRYWRAIYGSVHTFRDQFELRSRRIEEDETTGGRPPSAGPIAVASESYKPVEPSEDVKLAVKKRDNWTCLSCGSTDKKHLQVDHIQSAYHGGGNELANLQTLCKRCNSDKGVSEENFLVNRTRLNGPHPDFRVRLEPSFGDRGDREAWARCVRATLNHYYRCAAVSDVAIGAKGPRFYTWQVTLAPHNDPRFLEKHLPGFLASIRARRKGFDGADELLVQGSDAEGRPQSARATARGRG